jgi:hypothetical protein
LGGATSGARSTKSVVRPVEISVALTLRAFRSPRRTERASIFQLISRVTRSTMGCTSKRPEAEPPPPRSNCGSFITCPRLKRSTRSN